ncbi:MAG: FAD-dependent oxidoreductase [Thiohalocapsa sp.]
MSDRKHSHIVIGGGISGLSAAHYAIQASVDTLVVERNQRLGGCMQTHTFAELGGFWVEAGSHSCFNSYGNLLAIMEQLDVLKQATAKTKQSYQLWSGGQRKSVLSALHIPELLLSLPRLLRQSKAESSVLEYYGKGLGERNYQDLLGPAFRSVICQTADNFPADAMFRKKPRRKDVLRNFTMPTGLGAIPAAIAATPGLRVESGRAVTGIAAEGSGFVLRLEDGSKRACTHLTLAVPPDEASRLLTGVAPNASAVIGRIGMTEIDTLLLAFCKSDLPVPEIAGLISVDGPFLSAVSRDFLADDRYRGFAFHFPRGSLTDTDRIAAACAALSVSPDRPAAIAHATNRLPCLRKGHQDLIGELDHALADRPIGTTGNWFLGVSIEDCVTRSRSECVRLFTNGRAAV